MLKASTQGTLQVAWRELSKLSGPQATLRVVIAKVGDVTPSDVFMAETVRGVVVGFGVRVLKEALRRAKGVEVSSFATLQDVVAEGRRRLEESLPTITEEHQIGRVEIRRVIKASKLGRIAGCFVIAGVVRRNAQLRLVRNGVVIWQGQIASLKRFKDEVKEVRENFECGLRLSGQQDIEAGDQLEVLEIRRVKQRLTC